METLILIAALACQPGYSLLDWSGKLPRELQFLDLVVFVKPFYTRIYIYQLRYPDSVQQCCSNKPTSVIRVPVGDGRFCVRQSQRQMKCARAHFSNQTLRFENGCPAENTATAAF